MGATQKRKRVLLVVGGIIALLAVAAATVFILSRFNVAQPSTSRDTSQLSHVAAKDVIEALSTSRPASVAALAGKQVTGDQFKVTVKIPGKPFSIAVPAQYSLWLSQEDGKDVSNVSDVLSQSKAFFESKGLAETISAEASASYASDVAVCQVQIQAGETGRVLYGCTDIKIAQDEYEAIAKLIGLYNRVNVSQPLLQTAFSGAERTVQKSDSIQGAIVSLLPTSATTTGKILLFGAINDNWEYVADITTGNSTGKANVPDEALPLIKDKKWNGVLAGLVGVE